MAGYELRIMDWSSDLCSSDLAAAAAGTSPAAGAARPAGRARLRSRPARDRGSPPRARSAGRGSAPAGPDGRRRSRTRSCLVRATPQHRQHRGARLVGQRLALDRARSEEHTSELQSLMRISYAVFCLKTKKTITYTRTKITDKKANSKQTKD